MNICEKLPKLFIFFGYIINIAKILVPIIIVIYGSIDLIKAVVAKNEEKIKEGYIVLFKRLGIGITIFFVPSIIYFIISLTPIDRSNSKLCFECMDNPKKCIEDINIKKTNITVECTNTQFSTRDQCCKYKYNKEMIYNYKIGCVKPDILIEE